jgi:tellurite methyltransferase
VSDANHGGYDDGYRDCPCFWGDQPSSFVKALCELKKDLLDAQILDVGCGEGKNAIFLANQGARVQALDVSQLAIENARRHWAAPERVQFVVADVQDVPLPEDEFDVVIAYGLLHCLPTHDAIVSTMEKLKRATRRGGYHIICAFNNRSHNLSAHPNFHPTLLAHEEYVGCYSRWITLRATDSDLHETHPHNNIPHWHSLTRILAQKPHDLPT